MPDVARLIVGRRFEQVVRIYYRLINPSCTFERVVVNGSGRRGRLDDGASVRQARRIPRKFSNSK
jgi:hypothetical protein